MAHAIDAHHDAPLQLGITLQKAGGVIGQRAHHRDRQEHVNRDEHGEQVEMLRSHQPILHGQHHKKSQHQAAVVASARGRQRHELAQGKKRHQRKQTDGHPVTGQPADPEHKHHHPAGAQNPVQIAQFVAAFICGSIVTVLAQ